MLAVEAAAAAATAAAAAEAPGGGDIIDGCGCGLIFGPPTAEAVTLGLGSWGSPPENDDLRAST